MNDLLAFCAATTAFVYAITYTWAMFNYSTVEEKMKKMFFDESTHIENLIVGIISGIIIWAAWQHIKIL